MKYTALLAALAALLIANQSANAQGALTPPGAPAESQKSLQEIYDAIQALKTDVAFLVQQAVPSVPGMVAVLGGTLPEASELAGETVSRACPESRISFSVDCLTSKKCWV